MDKKIVNLLNYFKNIWSQKGEIFWFWTNNLAITISCRNKILIILDLLNQIRGSYTVYQILLYSYADHVSLLVILLKYCVNFKNLSELNCSKNVKFLTTICTFPCLRSYNMRFNFITRATGAITPWSFFIHFRLLKRNQITEIADDAFVNLTSLSVV